MIPKRASTSDRNAFLENLAAELTSAAYPVVLRHGVGGKWLDLELDLWKALTESVKSIEEGTLPSRSNFDELCKPSTFSG